MSGRIWRNHPGLDGRDGIRVKDGFGHSVWYTAERAREVIAELQAGLRELEGGTE